MGACSSVAYVLLNTNTKHGQSKVMHTQVVYLACNLEGEYEGG